MERLSWIVDPLLIVISASALAALVVYLGGARARLMLVRQKLFSIRDALWDAAHETGGFKEPAYLRARALLNDAVHAVDWLSIPVMLLVLIRSPEQAVAVMPPEDIQTQDPRLKAAIEQAYRQLMATCLRHAILRPSGWTVLLLWVFFVGARNSWSSVAAWMKNWLAGGGLHALADLDRGRGLNGRRRRAMAGA